MVTTRSALLTILVSLVLVIAYGELATSALADPPQVSSGAPSAPLADHYILLGWNDLGMHCYNRDFTNLAVLPPYNTLWAQVVMVGEPPQIVTAGITIEYSFPDNTYSVGKSNFWDTIPGSNPPKQIAASLFGLPSPLPADTGLTGKKLTGTMDLNGDHFEAVGIPLTEYRDQDVSSPDPQAWPRYPYQEAVLTARLNGVVIAQQTVVAPVSTEMRCDNCHGVGKAEDQGTGKTETNILALHDEEELSRYPVGHRTPLLQRQPVLCAECHSSNALAAPGVAGIPSLSTAMHAKHTEAHLPAGTQGCYNCHPGPTTKCLRDAMSEQHGMTCVDCHGTLQRVAVNPNPWLQEPRCDNASCHGSKFAQDQPLYRMSTGHGGIRCEACHDSTHAIAPSREPNDAIKFVNLQGYAGTLRKCSVCHTTNLSGIIHPAAMFLPPRIYLPLLYR